MAVKINIEERKIIWIAISDLYLDTELDETDFKHIAKKIKESPYSLAQAKQIDKEEVFPVLYTNLLYLVGVWSGFNEDELIANIIKKIQSRNSFKQFIHNVLYARMRWMFSGYWKNIDKYYHEI
jgi:hypothetical protein